MAKINKEEQRWQAEDALRTLQRAEQIRKDKKLMASVRTVAKEQMQSIQRIQSVNQKPKKK